MQIDLYHLWDCPHAARVRDFVERNRMRQYVHYVDIDDDLDAEDRLEEIAGDVRTPCLVADGKVILGSAPIISWLKDYFLGDRPTPSLR